LAPTKLYPLSLHDALPIYTPHRIASAAGSGALPPANPHPRQATNLPGHHIEENTMAQTLYDPPSGWRYGFPKAYQPLPGETLERSEEHTSELQSREKILCH